MIVSDSRVIPGKYGADLAGLQYLRQKYLREMACNLQREGVHMPDCSIRYHMERGDIVMTMSAPKRIKIGGCFAL